MLSEPKGLSCNPFRIIRFTFFLLRNLKKTLVAITPHLLIPKAETRAIHKRAQTFLPRAGHPGHPLPGLVIVVRWRIKGNSLQ